MPQPSVEQWEILCEFHIHKIHKILTQGVLKIRCKRGSKARSIGGGFKLFHHGLDGKRNGAGVILKEEYLNSFVEVKSVRQNHENENHEV